MSVVTVLPEACNKHIKATPTRSLKSMESIYSITPTSSKFSVLSRRKINQKINRDRNPTLVPAVSEIKQRVLSARMLRMKQLQNQIGEAHHRIAELTSENRLLKSLHKRQDSALSKYENSNAELPQLLHSHAEELRMWQTRCRNLQRQNKDLQAKMKQKETILLTISDQNKQLLQLNKDKNLQERAGLQERVRILEQRCMDKENEIKLLARRLQLESKAFKSNLTLEQQKYRDLITKIEMSDFLTITDKKAIPHKAKALYNKSPLNRIASKSAASVSHVNDEKESSAGTTTTLPPCSNEPKRVIDENKHQNTPSVNNNVKLEIIDASESELDLTKNCIDKSSLDENDETSNRVKNGMIRARQQNQLPNNKNTSASTKTSTKLSPLHTEHPFKSIDNTSEKKSICNDSELSDDDEFQFFSNHNGTKTTHNNARELLEHKMHINELEEKMKQNSLDDNNKNAHHQCPSPYLPKTSNSSSLSSHDDLTLRNEDMTHYTFIDDRGDNELVTIQREIRDSTLQRESILDEYCETIFDDDKHSHYSENTITRVKKIEFARGAAANNNSYGHTNGVIGGSYSTAKNQNQSSYQINDYAKSNGHAKTGTESTAGRKEINGKSTKLDDKKKTRLLAILKNIDGSVEN